MRRRLSKVHLRVVGMKGSHSSSSCKDSIKSKYSRVVRNSGRTGLGRLRLLFRG